jgi:hypothetical protein
MAEQGIESFVDEVLRLHEAIKANNESYGYIDCRWPPEEEAGLFALFYSAIEQLKAARSEQRSIDAKTLEEARKYRELIDQLWGQALSRGLVDN